jgi:hypothetical protein
MTIPAPLPGTNPNGIAADPEPLKAPHAAPKNAAPALAYPDFVTALKVALRDFHSTDLLARNPLLRSGIGNLDESAGPLDLKALLSETVSTLFGNPRDEKLRRVIELTYFQPAPKQEVVADRLSLSFGTYRRHLTTGRERLVRWLWGGLQVGPIQSELPPTGPANGVRSASETPKTSKLVMPRRRGSDCGVALFNIAVTSIRFADRITETLTTDLSRCFGVLRSRARSLSPIRASRSTAVRSAVT